MNFKQFFEQLTQRVGPEFTAGPAAFRRLMARLGNPQNQYKIIHVAGTNGKGSVCHLCAEVLQTAGYKTGLFISPHLHTPRERVRINGRRISGPDFLHACEKVLASEEEKLSFFEILTAAALVYFAQKKVQYVVLETGLGGRKDPTNICTPAACVITSVGLDHCQILGDNLAQIAREKAGIIKPGVPVFCPNVAKETLSEIKRTSLSVGAPLYIAREGEPFTLHKIQWQKGCLLLKKGRAIWPLHLLGEKQVQNACLVYQVCCYLGITEKAIKQAFAHVYVPGRFEIVKQGKNTLIFDGAHNPPAVQALVDFIVKSPWAASATLVCGFMKDKDYSQMLALLAPHFDAIYVTRLTGARAAELKAVKAAMPPGAPAFYFTSPTQALKEARQAQKTVLVTGSFYLAGRLRARHHARKD